MNPTLLAAVLWTASPSLAQGLEDDLPEAGETAPADEDFPEAGETADPEDGGEPDADGGELFELEEEAAAKPGEDTADIYRRQQNELLEAEPEERLQAWEAYLAKYPNSAFLEQISKAIAEAEEEMYSGSGIRDEVSGLTDKRQILFPETALGENLNPATRVKAGFAIGLPSYVNLTADAEYALSSRFSLHAGMLKRIPGWALEVGPRFALVKAEDPGLIVTVAGDVHVGVDPAFIGLKPSLLAGIEPVDNLFVQAQGSQEWELFQGAWTPRYRGGANITYRAAQPVALWVEGALESKYLQFPGGAHVFHQVAFGMRFYPMKDSKREDMVDVLMGAAVPAMFQYWNDVHEGSAMVSGYAYLE